MLVSVDLEVLFSRKKTLSPEDTARFPKRFKLLFIGYSRLLCKEQGKRATILEGITGPNDEEAVELLLYSRLRKIIFGT